MKANKKKEKVLSTSWWQKNFLIQGVWLAKLELGDKVER